jgi:hypothetical protein
LDIRDGYVIAAIPAFIEKKACNAEESYQLGSNGTSIRLSESVV